MTVSVGYPGTWISLIDLDQKCRDISSNEMMSGQLH